MNDDHDKEQIRQVITTWMNATAAGDLDTVLGLMAEDVVYLRHGQPPMHGREAFATATRGALGKAKIEGTPNIQEVHISGSYAYCWNHLSLTITPQGGGQPQKREGDILSVFRQEPDGRWVLFRDANLL
jgi:uncharacterized protein (TIGR02246 family)